MSERNSERAGKFIDYLAAHREDRGVMADLRRGGILSAAYRAWPYLAAWCDLTDDRQRIIHQTVAAAYAFHPEETNEGTVGRSLRLLAMGDKRGEEGLKTFDARFRRLLACDSTIELCRHLPGVLRALGAKGIPVNYRQLFDDLSFWGERTRLEWAREYWGEPDKGGAA